MTLFSNKININEGKKYDTSQVSQDGISKEELAEIEKKNKKLIDIYKALGAGDGMSSIDLAKAMDGFSKMDTSGDGKLSKKELEAGAEAFNKEHGTNIKGKDLKDFLKSIRKATKDDTKVETNKVLEKEAARVKLQNDVDVAVEKFLGDLEAKTKAREAAEAKAEAEAKAAAEAEAKAKAEDLKTPKSYTVQPNERLESILKRSLEAQGIEVNDENMAKAKEEFIQNNPKALHGPKGKEYLYAADVIKVPGNLEDKANGDEIKAKLKPADPPADPPKTEKPVPPSIARPTEETEKPVVPSFELQGFVPKDDGPAVQIPYAPPSDESGKKPTETPPLSAEEKVEAAKKAEAEKVGRLNKALDDMSPSSDYTVSGVRVNNIGKERLTKENKELLDEIAKGDNPAFAARALMAASKGFGTNDVLFEAVLNAGKDSAYFENIDKELKKQGTTVFALAREEFTGSSGRTGSDNKAYKEYYDARIGMNAPSEAKKLGYTYYGGTGTYLDANKNKYNWNHKTLEFVPVKS